MCVAFQVPIFAPLRRWPVLRVMIPSGKRHHFAPFTCRMQRRCRSSTHMHRLACAMPWCFWRSPDPMDDDNATKPESALEVNLSLILLHVTTNYDTCCKLLVNGFLNYKITTKRMMISIDFLLKLIWYDIFKKVLNLMISFLSTQGSWLLQVFGCWDVSSNHSIIWETKVHFISIQEEE